MQPTPLLLSAEEGGRVLVLSAGAEATRWLPPRVAK